MDLLESPVHFRHRLEAISCQSPASRSGNCRSQTASFQREATLKTQTEFHRFGVSESMELELLLVERIWDRLVLRQLEKKECLRLAEGLTLMERTQTFQVETFDNDFG